jgi:hypothetical protein
MLEPTRRSGISKFKCCKTAARWLQCISVMRISLTLNRVLLPSRNSLLARAANLIRKVIQGHRGTGTQRHRDTEAQGHRGTGTQGHRVTGSQGHRDTGAQVHRCTGARGHTHARRKHHASHYTNLNCSSPLHVAACAAAAFQDASGCNSR